MYLCVEQGNFVLNRIIICFELELGNMLIYVIYLAKHDSQHDAHMQFKSQYLCPMIFIMHFQIWQANSFGNHASVMSKAYIMYTFIVA